MKRLAMMGVAWSLALLMAMSSANAQEESDGNNTEIQHKGTHLGVMIGSSPGGSPLVLRVQRDSLADRVGIQHGDFILSVAGEKIESPENLKQAITSQKIGEPFTMTTWRAGEKHSLEITLTEDVRVPSQDNFDGRAWLGIMVRESEDDGAEIARMYVGSPADTAGIQVGDRISQINGQDVSSPKAVSQYVKKLDTGDEAELVIDREGEQHTISVTVGNLEDFHERLFGKRFRSKFDDFHEMFDPDFDGVPERFFGVEREALRELIREFMDDLPEFREGAESENVGDDEL